MNQRSGLVNGWPTPVKKKLLDPLQGPSGPLEVLVESGKEKSTWVSRLVIQQILMTV